MYYDEVEYILKYKGKIVSQSRSMASIVKVSQAEKVARLHFADDIFYCDKEIESAILHLKNGKKDECNRRDN